MRTLALLPLGLLVACGATVTPPGPPVAVTGMVHEFGPGGGGLKGAIVSVVDAPEITAAVGEDGSFQLQVPSGSEHAFVVHKPGFHDTQTATLEIGTSGLDQVGFQVPSDEMFDLLAGIVNVRPNPEYCQIATTVSAAGTAPYGGAGLGEPDATVSIDPPLPSESGPVYFQYVSESMIVPNRTLEATTIDGGVLFLDVPPGEYRLSATKEGKAFTSVKLHCRAGLLVNAAPPRGIQGL